MAGLCKEGETFGYSGSLEILREYYQNPDIKETLPEFFDSLRRSGVHAVQIDNNTAVHITRRCPNNIQGVCIRGDNCFAAFVEQNPPKSEEQSGEKRERIKKQMRDALG